MLMRMLFPNGKRKAFTLSYDDGVEYDIRLIEIFNKYKVKATFNLNGSHFLEEEREFTEGNLHRPLARRRGLEVYGGELCKDHEIALHSYSHPYLERLPVDMQTYEIIKDREFLENMFDRIIKGCAYPMGTFSDTTVSVLKNCGVSYARTTIPSHNFNVPKDWLRLSPTCHHKDPELFNLAERFIVDELPYNQDAWLFYVWGHSFEFPRDNNWERIEELLKMVALRDDVWYATNIEIYEYVKAYERLEFSAVGDRVYNPSAIPVYFHYAGVDVCVMPNECKKFR